MDKPSAQAAPLRTATAAPGSASTAAPLTATAAPPLTATAGPPLTAPAAAPLSATAAPPLTATGSAPRRASARFMAAHPARWVALGFGSGLSPWAPGTVGTLWSWVAWWAMAPWLNDWQWATLLIGAFALGWWACTRCAQHLGLADPGAIVWDEVIAFWLVLWLIQPAGLGSQLMAFALFRYFDAAKPGPVGWADRLFKLQSGQAIGWRQGFGILFDDLVAAACTLLLMALWRAVT